MTHTLLFYGSAVVLGWTGGFFYADIRAWWIGEGRAQWKREMSKR